MYIQGVQVLVVVLGMTLGGGLCKRENLLNFDKLVEANSKVLSPFVSLLPLRPSLCWSSCFSCYYSFRSMVNCNFFMFIHAESLEFPSELALVKRIVISHQNKTKFGFFSAMYILLEYKMGSNPNGSERLNRILVSGKTIIRLKQPRTNGTSGFRRVGMNNEGEQTISDSSSVEAAFWSWGNYRDTFERLLFASPQVTGQL